MQTENIRIAYIDEIPPGTSKVTFKLFVPKEQYDLGPLSLQGFKVGSILIAVGGICSKCSC